MTSRSRGVHYVVRSSLLVGVVASGLTLLASIGDPRRALLGWIAAYGLAVATVIGSMILVMIMDLTGARWWLVVRELLLAVVDTTPLLVLGFVPIALGYDLVYPWAAPRASFDPRTAAVLEHQEAWNRPAWFLLRSALYLASWIVLALLLRRAAARRAVAPLRAASLERRLAAVGIPTSAFGLTFAAFDGTMALQPAYGSTIFGIYVFTSGLVSALAITAVAVFAGARGALVRGVAPDHVHAIGRLLLMALILWAYIAFFQLVLVWIANIPRETAFYVARSRGAWLIVGAILVIGRFAIPFVALLSRSLKRSARALAAVGGWLLLTSVIEHAWFVLPSVGATLSASIALPNIAVAGLLCAYAVHRFAERHRTYGAAPLDPYLDEALRYRSP